MSGAKHAVSPLASDTTFAAKVIYESLVDMSLERRERGANGLKNLVEKFGRALESTRAALHIVFLGVAIRAAMLVVLVSRPLADDALDYHGMALQLLSGLPFEPDWPPGVPYYLALGYKIFGQNPIVGRILMIPVYVAFSAALFSFTRSVANRRAANIALLIFAMYPSYIFVSVTPLTQLPAAALLLASLVVGRLCIAERKLVWFLLLGALSGLLVLARPPNLLACAAIPLLVIVRTRSVAAIIGPALSFALLFGAWTYKAHSMTGRYLFINNSNSQNMYYGNNPWTPLYRTWWFGSHKRGEPGVPDEFVEEHSRLSATGPAQRDKAFSARAMQHIRERPDLFAVRSLSRVRTFFAFDTFAGAQFVKKGAAKKVGYAILGIDALFYLGTMLLAIVGIYWRRPAAAFEASTSAATSPPFLARDTLQLAFIAALFTALPYFLSFSHPTYHFAVVPIFGIFAADALSRLLGGEKFEWRELPTARRTMLIVTTIAFLLIQVEWVFHMADRA